MTASKRGHTGISGGRQLRIRRHNHQLFTNKAALGSGRQIIDNGFIWVGLIFNDLVDFQRPDWICCSFGPALKFARLIQIPHIYERRKFFSATPTGLLYFVDGFEETAFSLIATAGFLPVRLVTSLFRALTTPGSLFTHSVDFLPSGRSISTAY